MKFKRVAWWDSFEVLDVNNVKSFTGSVAKEMPFGLVAVIAHDWKMGGRYEWSVANAGGTTLLYGNAETLKEAKAGFQKEWEEFARRELLDTLEME